MQVRAPRALRAGGLCAMLVAVGAVLPAVEVPGGQSPASSAAGPLLVRHAGRKPVTVDTTRLAGPALRGWWVDATGDTAVDAGSVPRDRAVELYPPDTGDGAAHDWTLVVVDATRDVGPPA